MVEWNEKMEGPPEPMTTLIVVNPGGDEAEEDGPVPVQTAIYAPGGLPLSALEGAASSEAGGSEHGSAAPRRAVPPPDESSPADIALRERADEHQLSAAARARTTPANAGPRPAGGEDEGAAGAPSHVPPSAGAA